MMEALGLLPCPCSSSTGGRQGNGTFRRAGIRPWGSGNSSSWSHCPR